ncbi:hypothetical protein MMC30_009026 [Trapelia coarctata]|nr:hypothetical protein [Trapelia coarctata]
MGSMPNEDVRGVFADYEQNSSAQKIATEVVLTSSLRARYPGMIVSIVDSSCDLFGYAVAGYARYKPDPENGDFILQQRYHGPRGRLSTKEGSIKRDDILSKYEYSWEGHTFLLYRAQVYRPYSLTMPTSCFILKKAEDGESIYGNSAITDKLITACSKWSAESHEEIWVFDQGYWDKSKELYQAVHDAKWEDVILDEGVKKSLIKDVEGFFDAQETYKRFGIPWKRGIIFHGPPGNGKTISIKAVMRSLATRPNPVPSFYVKSFYNCKAPEFSIADIFKKAREASPCFLILEDLDSLVTDKLRSYFLNEVDGLHSNEGILILGSTNHLEKLDPAIVKRPSRFDRKYHFHPPNESERIMYAEYWRQKLDSVPEVTMSADDCQPIANLTEGFTFAYLKEAFIATLFYLFQQREAALAKGEISNGGSSPSKDSPSAFLNAFETQVAMLKEQMADEKKSEDGKKEKKEEDDEGDAEYEMQLRLLALQMRNRNRNNNG